MDVCQKTGLKNWADCPGADRCRAVDSWHREKCPVFERAEKLRRIAERWPIPPRFRGATLDQVERETPALALGLRNFLGEIGEDLGGVHGSVVLTGGYGVGKTWAAAAAVSRAMELGIPAAFVPGSALLDRLKASFNGGGENESAIIAELQGVELLMLDDLGKGKLSDYAIDVLWRVLSVRHDHGRGSIVTTNLSAKELAVTDGLTAIVERLTEGGLIFKMAGETRRSASGIVEVKGGSNAQDE